MTQFPPIDMVAIAEAIDPGAAAPRKPEPRALTLRIADGIETVTIFALAGFLCALFAGA